MRNLRASQIVPAIADAAARWRDADYPPRVRVANAAMERTGYTAPVVDYAFDRLFGALDERALVAAIEDELGSLHALDGFVARPGRPDVHFRGLDKVAIVSSDTTLGVAIPALAFALCAKAHVSVKEGAEGLVRAFSNTLAEERPEFAAAIDARTWHGADETAARANLGDAGAVVAYGRDATLTAIRSILSAGARFFPFGHRTSIGYVSREALDDTARAGAAAHALALDALLYDGDGCLSLHVAFVQIGARTAPADFARAVAAACDDVAVEFPAGYTAVDPAVAAYQRTALFRAAQGSGAVYAGVAPHLVVFNPPHTEAPPLLRRTLAIYAVDDPDDAFDYVRQHALALEAVAVCGAAGHEFERLAIASGASRIAQLGTLQNPPLSGEHGGAGRILPFVRAIYRA